MNNALLRLLLHTIVFIAFSPNVALAENQVQSDPLVQATYCEGLIMAQTKFLKSQEYDCSTASSEMKDMCEKNNQMSESNIQAIKNIYMKLMFYTEAKDPENKMSFFMISGMKDFNEVTNYLNKKCSIYKTVKEMESCIQVDPDFQKKVWKCDHFDMTNF